MSPPPRLTPHVTSSFRRATGGRLAESLDIPPATIVLSMLSMLSWDGRDGDGDFQMISLLIFPMNYNCQIQIQNHETLRVS